MIDAKDYKSLKRFAIKHAENIGTFNVIEQGAVRKLEKDTTELNFVPKSLQRTLRTGRSFLLSGTNINSVVFHLGSKVNQEYLCVALEAKNVFQKRVYGKSIKYF